MQQGFISLLIEKIHRILKTDIKYLKKNLLIVMSVLFVLTGVLYYQYQGTKDDVQETMVVAKQQLNQYVSITGAVQPSRDVSLAFQTGGAVEFVGVKIGDTVTQGKVLATLSSSDGQASLLQAEATLENARATYDQLSQGARKEEVAIKQQAVDNAKSSLDQVSLTLPDTIRNVDSVTADAIKNKLSGIFSYSGGRYVLSFTSCDQTLQSAVEEGRMKIEGAIGDYQRDSSIITSISSTDTIITTFDKAYAITNATNNFINTLSQLLLATCSSQNTQLDAYRTSLALVRTNINALFGELSVKRSSLLSATNVYNQAKRDLDLTLAGTDPFRLRSQAALIKQAEAQVAQAKSNIAKTVIRAPFDGTVSDVTVVKGETVTTGKTIVSMLTTNAFEVETKIPEIDIIKISLGSQVNITLDAYGAGVVFPATVTRISPTATELGNVPVYKVIVTFAAPDPRIRAGMTANVKIKTESKEDVLAIPARFITVINQTQGTVIRQKTDGKKTQQEVVNLTLGTRGENGLIEVTSGLQLGDVLVAPNTTTRAAQKNVE